MSAAEHVNRRAILGGIALLPAAPVADQVAQLSACSPILALFREWQAAFDRCSDMATPEAEVGQLVTVLNDLEDRMLALPSTSAADMAAKFIAHSGHGDYVIEEDSPFWKEALALVGGPATGEAGL